MYHQKNKVLDKFKKIMKKHLLVLGISFLISSCVTYYRTSTDFYELQRGMTKQQFINWVQPSYTDNNGRPINGGKPVETKTFKYGEDVWEVWVFDVYRPLLNSFGNPAGITYDHKEYIAFKNGLVEEWGTGTLPITIRQNPNQINVDIKH